MGKKKGVGVLSGVEQYEHLRTIEEKARNDRQLAAAIGVGYTIAPDVLVCRKLDGHEKPLLHAVVSTKWTLRSDRSQNVRTEALTLIRNRKGRLPHFVAVTAEPLPSRLASIALGTGDLDCIYHLALPELIQTLESLASPEPNEWTNQLWLLNAMYEGKRLKDVLDLPADLRA